MVVLSAASKAAWMEVIRAGLLVVYLVLLSVGWMVYSTAVWMADSLDVWMAGRRVA